MKTTKSASADASKLSLSAQGQAYLHSVRTSPPSRRVNGHRSLTGLFPSRKMRVSSQYESANLELPVIYQLEFDPNVLEYYDQPPSIVIHEKDTNGKTHSHRIYPDFFVVRPDRYMFIDCKPEAELVKLAAERPDRFVRNELGEWRCPAAEAAAAELGFGFQVISSAQLSPTFQGNLALLHEHLRMGHPPVPPKIRKAVDAVIREQFAPTIKSVCSEVEGLKLYQVFELILDGNIIVDLESERLCGANDIRLFPTQRALQTFKEVLATEASTGLIHDLNLRLREGDTFRFQSTVYTVYDRTSEYLTVGNGDGPVSKWRMVEVRSMLSAGLIKAAPRSLKIDPSKTEGASQKEWAAALKRLEAIRPYLKQFSKPKRRHEKKETTRSIRRWLKAYRIAKDRSGWGLVGLLDRKKSKGNRVPPFLPEVEAIMCEVIDQVYGTPECSTVFLAYGFVVNRCKEKSLPVPCMAAFYKLVKRQDAKKMAEQRVGPRAAYQVDWMRIASDTPPHGDWPFHICHIDHTLLDVELVSSITGKNLGRPWLTILIDAYSRRILAFNLWFDEPSYRACMAIVDQCVRRYERMPNTLVVDNGMEFQSIYFKSLIEGFEGTIKYRPPAQARFGSICERMFGTTNTQFVHNLLGNTRIMKNVRMVTKDFNPKNRAAWTLESLTVALREYFFEHYDTTEHPALQMSPRTAYEMGLDRVGQAECTPVPYNDQFRILCLPAPRKSTVQLNRRSGLRVNRFDYMAPELRDPRLENTPIEVRYNPDDITVCYALVHHKWVECRVRNSTQLRHWTEKQAHIATKEIREQGKRRGQGLPEHAATLAANIADLRTHEEFLLQRDKDEAKRRAKDLLIGAAALDALFAPDDGPAENVVSFSPEKPEPKRAPRSPKPSLKSAVNESYGHM